MEAFLIASKPLLFVHSKHLTVEIILRGRGDEDFLPKK